MASANEIRKWMIGSPNKSENGLEGQLFFRLPEQPSNLPGCIYQRCAGEQRVIVETEIAAQLAELNENLRNLAVMLERKRFTSPRRRFGKGQRH